MLVEETLSHGLTMKAKTLTFCMAILAVCLLFPHQADSQGSEKSLTLAQAVMCEEVRDNAPYNQGVVFSMANEKVCCFSTFDPVPERTFIYHRWFRRDRLITSIKLSLQPPRWSTVSRIQLREADKGPWRVEITDQTGRVFRILRFSITD
jgi:hypothetical protein